MRYRLLATLLLHPYAGDTRAETGTSCLVPKLARVSVNLVQVFSGTRFLHKKFPAQKLHVTGT